MRPLYRYLAFSVAACSSFGLFIWLSRSTIAAAPPQDPLAASFRNPPDSAKPHTWWHWLNGNTSKEGITADLEAMKRAGIGGVQIFNVDCGLPDGPVPVMSDAWEEHTRHAIAEAARLGLEVCVHNCPGWSSSGGPWVRPEHAMQMLTWSEREVAGPARFAEKLAQPPTRQGYYRDIAVLAMPLPADEQAARYRIRHIGPKSGYDRPPSRDPDIEGEAPPGAPLQAVRNISSHMAADGTLNWDVPAGKWLILRLGHTCTGAVNAPAPVTGRGLEVDKLSREAMDAFWPGFMGRVIKAAGPHAGKVLNNALIDSYETGYQNWTPRFRQEFERLRGYDPLPYLPVVTGRIVGNLEMSERFLWDFRRTIADLWAANYYGYFAELCKKHGMLFSTEPYGNGNFDNLQCGGIADVPMGEFWAPQGWALETAKLAASAAHTHGRRIVGAESFTADETNGRWLLEPAGIKALGDLVFTRGVNRYIFHRYAHQPWLHLYPGMTMGPWGMHLERTVTWWEHAPAWFRYISRCQYLLQTGLFVADVCYFVGEAGPNDLPGRQGLEPVLPTGYDYDGCDATVVLKRMRVQNGRIVLPDGMSYAMLVLPPSRFMTPAMIRTIANLVRDGATVVGPRPEQSPSLTGYPACDVTVRQLAMEVWGPCDGTTVKEHRYGRGRVFWGLSMPEILRRLRILPDFEVVSPASARLEYIHRRIGAAEVYFVSNQQQRTVTATCRFRVAGKSPELWDPETGSVRPAPVWRPDQGRTLVQLRLDPTQSVFVVFRKPAPGSSVTSVRRFGATPDAEPEERIEIRMARYEARDGSRGADVTARVRQLVADGETEIPATNSVFGDPVPLVVKRLRISWLLNGQPREATVDEGGVIPLGIKGRRSAQLEWDLEMTNQGLRLVPWLGGRYEITLASGRKIQVPAQPGAKLRPVTEPWSLAFPVGWGASARVPWPKLISWTDHDNEGIRYFSGTATYSTEFTLDPAFCAAGRQVVLDLGTVKNFARVILNGRDLGSLWKAPFRVPVTGIVRPGKNTLVVKVTNLWPNRLIGDEQYPPEVEWNGNAIKAWPDWVWSNKPRPASLRRTFTTWRFWTKNDRPLESGLLGPVALRSARVLELPLPSVRPSGNRR